MNVVEADVLLVTSATSAAAPVHSLNEYPVGAAFATIGTVVFAKQFVLPVPLATVNWYFTR